MKDREEAERLRNEAKTALQRDAHFDEAECLAMQAVRLDEGAHNLIGLAKSLSIAATAQFRLGRTTTAQEGFQRAAALRPGHTGSLNNLAMAVAHRGRLEEALDLYERALVALEGGSSIQRAKVLNNMGMLCDQLGWARDALNRYELARTCLAAAVPSEDRERTFLHVLNNQAVVLRRTGKLRQAARMDRKVLKLAQTSGYQRGEASARHNLGIDATHRGRLRKAELQYGRALKLRRSHGDPAEISMTLHNLGALAARRSRYSTAVAAFSEAYPLREQVGNPVTQVQTLLGWGQALANLGRPQDARHRYEQARALIEQTRLGIANNEVRQAYLASIGRVYAELAVLIASGGELEEAWIVSEHGRARVLKERISSWAEAPEELADAQRAVLDEYAEVCEALNAAEGIDSTLREREMTLRRELRRIGSQLNDTQPLSVTNTSSDFVRELLSPDETLVSFVLGETESIALVLEPEAKLRCKRLPARGDVEMRTARFIRAILRRRYSRQAARWLRKTLLGGLGLESPDLVIAPDGELHRLPWAALPGRNRKYLIDERSIRQVAAVSLVASSPLTNTYRSTLIALAAPLDGRTQDPARANECIQTKTKLRPIPHTVEEVRAVADVMRPKWPDGIHIREREKATRRELQELLSTTGPPRFLHLACHGVMHPDDAMLSGVALTRQDGHDAEIWRGPDMLVADLRCELAVVSACQTALGPMIPGEGIANLAHILRSAGANNACVALWDVSDETAPELMSAFYQGVTEEKSLARALAGAQERMAAGSHNHPFHWAWAVLT